MWLDDFQIQHIELPFKDPIKVGNEIIKQKKSLYLTLNFSNKKSGTGEISLLPGLIDLSPKEAIEEVNLFLLPLLKKKIEGIDKPIKESDLKTLFFNKLPKPEYKIASPVIFAIESALLSWNKATFQSNFEDLFPGTKDDFTIPVNDLLYPNEEKLDLNASSFKIKIGRFNQNKSKNEEISFIKKVAENLKVLPPKNSKRIRLDGNRSFSLSSLQSYIDLIDLDTLSQIEYLEEPLKDINQWELFYKKNGIGLGLDESIFDLEDNKIPLPVGTKALILKPSVIGGISKYFFYLIWGKERGIKVVVSSTFESSLGLFTLSLLASKEGKTPSGLSTYRYLDEKVPYYLFKTSKGRMLVQKPSNDGPEAREGNRHPL